jgi:hypothetical protein
MGRRLLYRHIAIPHFYRRLRYAVFSVKELTSSHIQSLVCMIGVLDLLFTINPASPTPPHHLVPLGLATYTLPLCTNVTVTSLIVYRIWSTSRASSDSPLDIGQGITRRAMMLSIESGALYLVVQLVFVVLFAIPHPAEAILAVMAVQIYVSNAPSDSKPISQPVLSLSQGIVPTLITIRVGLGISSENAPGGVRSAPMKWAARAGEQTGTSATNYTDGPSSRTHLERMKGCDLQGSGNPERDTELDVFRFEPTLRAEGSSSSV